MDSSVAPTVSGTCEPSPTERLVKAVGTLLAIDDETEEQDHLPDCKMHGDEWCTCGWDAIVSGKFHNALAEVREAWAEVTRTRI